ncbi:MAG TPA: hypothetical protein VGM54_25925 [Chthoniobacter sp.]|jgi:hypothetical protein
MISTDSLIRPAETSFYRVTVQVPTDPIALLIRAYCKAGLPMEDARRCAAADFQCDFPQLLGT